MSNQISHDSPYISTEEDDFQVISNTNIKKSAPKEDKSAKVSHDNDKSKTPYQNASQITNIKFEI